MVYRPPKKKLAAGSPADAAGSANRPSSTAADSTDPRQGDDRNLVKVDDSYAQASFEDRAWLFWHRNGNKIIGAAIGLCAAILVWQGWKLYQAHELENLQAVYESADSPASLQTFAQANPDTDLGKVAQLEAADAYFKNKQFKEAGAAYAQAATMWGKEPNAQRARLGQAMSALQGGDTSGGKQQLDAIFADTTLGDNIRGEAGFDLALLAYQEGDGATVSKWLQNVEGLSDANEWAGEAKRLAELIPVISNLQLTLAPTASDTGLVPGGMDLTRGVPSAPTVSAPGAQPTPPDTTSMLPASAPSAATPSPSPTPSPAPMATTSTSAPVTPPPAEAVAPAPPAAPSSPAPAAAPASTDLPSLVK
jgi:predicted negative regulator of RcsB-dependent stress response